MRIMQALLITYSVIAILGGIVCGLFDWRE